MLTSAAVLFKCQTRRGKRWAHCSNRFLLLHAGLPAAVSIGPQYCLRCTKRLETCVFLSLDSQEPLVVIYVEIDALSCSWGILCRNGTMICLSLLCISPLISLSGCSVSVEAKNISTINKSLQCTNRDRLLYSFFNLGPLLRLLVWLKDSLVLLFFSDPSLSLQKFCRHLKKIDGQLKGLHCLDWTAEVTSAHSDCASCFGC